MEFRDAKSRIMPEKMRKRAARRRKRKRKASSQFSQFQRHGIISAAVAERLDVRPLWRMSRDLRCEDSGAKRLVTCDRAMKKRRSTPELTTFLARSDATPVAANSAVEFPISVKLKLNGRRNLGVMLKLLAKPL